MRVISNIFFVAASFFVSSQAAYAGDIVDEVRIGVGGLLESSSSQQSGLLGSAEIYFAPFDSSYTGIGKIFLEPRVQLGVSGGTDAVDQAYAGLNWHVPITERFFAEFGAGGTVHNGNLDSGDGPRLGCRFLFREHASLGVAVTDKVNVLATIDHSSHANLCDGPNDGLTHAGLQLGVKF
jgi:lipid A 3-O-deacylase